MAKVEPLVYQDFNTLVLASPVPVVVNFFAPCPPCWEFEPLLEEIAEAFGDTASFFTLSMEESLEAVVKYKTKSVPLVLVFENGRETQRASDGVAIVDMLEKLAIELYKKRHYN